MKESDLYIPLREWLQARGFVVHVEVFECDVVAIAARHIRHLERLMRVRRKGGA